MHPPVVLIYDSYFTKINLFISINYVNLFLIPTKFMINKEKNISQWWVVSVVQCHALKYCFSRIAFSSVLWVATKKTCHQPWSWPLVNTSLISQFRENVIIFNFLANTLQWIVSRFLLSLFLANHQLLGKCFKPIHSDHFWLQSLRPLVIYLSKCPCFSIAQCYQ